MEDAADIGRRKRRSNRAVIYGVGLVAVAFLASLWQLAGPVPTTIAAVLGAGSIMYGVHVGWVIFYDREPDGPSS